MGLYYLAEGDWRWGLGRFASTASTPGLCLSRSNHNEAWNNIRHGVAPIWTSLSQRAKAACCTRRDHMDVDGPGWLVGGDHARDEGGRAVGMSPLPMYRATIFCYIRYLSGVCAIHYHQYST